MITNAHGALNSCCPEKRIVKLKEQREHIYEELAIIYDKLYIITSEINGELNECVKI